MAKVDTCACEDFDVEIVGDALTFRPSGRSMGKVLALSAAAVVLALGLLWWFEMLPGQGDAGPDLERAAQLDRQAQREDGRAQQILHGATGDSPGARGAASIHQRKAADHRRQADLARAGQSAAPPLGPTGQTITWGVAGALTLLAIALPLIHARERVTLLAPGDGTLRLVRRGQILPSRRYDLRDFQALGIVVQRVILYSRRYNQQEDKGWRWNVILAGPQEMLVIQTVREPTLPPQVERLTPRVRDVAQFLHRITGLPCRPPITTDISNITPGFGKTHVTTRARRHGPVEPGARYKPLN